MLRPAFQVIRLLPGRDAVGLLDRLLQHPQQRVRREALCDLCELDRRPGSPERHLARALGDSDSRLVAFAIQGLFTMNRPESIELLGAFVEGSLQGIEAGPASCERAAQGLAALGERGRHRLCQSLGYLQKRLRRGALRRGEVVRGILKGHRNEPEVRRALARWRYSLAGLLSMFSARSVLHAMEDEE
jgi:hypothetical protein